MSRRNVLVSWWFIACHPSNQEAARAYSLAGDAFGRASKPQYGEAIADYEKALSRVERSREETAWWDISTALALFVFTGVIFGE